MRWLLSFPVVVGLLLIAAGLRTLTAKRPLVLPVRWGLLAVLACFVPTQVALVVDPRVRLSLPGLSVELVLVALGALLCWVLLGGFVIVGATEGQLDAAMADALGRLQQPFEKTSEGMRLTAQDASLKVRMGAQDVWSVSISPRARRRVLVAVASGMRAYFASRNERGSRSGSYAWLVLGGVLVLWQLLESIVLGR